MSRPGDSQLEAVRRGGSDHRRPGQWGRRRRQPTSWCCRRGSRPSCACCGSTAS